MTQPEKTRIAVLGSGVGAMAAAFALTDPEVRGRYDVTVYQMGWRLGGKGASGRNAAQGDRIEEHGLHIWMGFYENAFRVMRAAYQELGRRRGEQPLATWDEAWKPQSYVVLDERLGGGGRFSWTFDFPVNPERPGDGGLVVPDLWGYFQQILSWMSERWSAREASFFPGVNESVEPMRAVRPPRMPAWVKKQVEKIEARPAAPIHEESPVELAPARPTRVVGAFRRRDDASGYLGQIMEVVRALSEDLESHMSIVHQALVWLIKAFMEAARLTLQGSVDTDEGAHRLWVEINIAGAAAVGILHDGLLYHGYGVIDDLDFREWLVKNGADPITADSAPVRGIYDLVFGFVGKDVKAGRLSAGVAVPGILRMLLTYRGAIFWEMQAGMGDVVFAPLYEVLEARGVTFEFFHRVTNLRLSDDRQSVGAIDLVRQVKLVNGAYDPLVTVKGLPCWPSEPRHEQIVGGGDLAASGINLESAWAVKWRDEEPRTLVLGRDFDKVVLGISIGAIGAISSELQAASPPFRAMLERIGTVQTFGFQLWLGPTTSGLGWQTPAGITEAPVLTAFSEPINTWGDLSYLTARESWEGAAPRSIAYFCGPFGEAAEIPPPFTQDPRHQGFPRGELIRLVAGAKTFLDDQIGALWPLAIKDGKFNRGLLVSEFYRVNVDPTERYVLSVPGSTRYRLAADRSGFDNLYLAGDWTDNVINASCVEAAAASGLAAARAISGHPATIAGEPPVPGLD